MAVTMRTCGILALLGHLALASSMTAESTKAPYYKMAAGKCCCPAANRITSYSVCVQAHHSLKLAHDKVWKGNDTVSIPSGCSSRPTAGLEDANFHFNGYVNQHKGRTDLVVVCKKAGGLLEETHKEVVLGADGNAQLVEASHPHHSAGGAPDAKHPTHVAGGKPFRQAVNGSTPTGWIQIGTPKKLLFVIFDTGSDKLVAKTWETVSAELATVDQGVAGMVLPSTLVYDHNTSSSYHRKFIKNPFNGKEMQKQTSITYGSGTAITDEGTENVVVGNRQLENYTVMEITADSLQLLHTSKGIAGVLGLQHMMNKSLGNSLFSRLREEDKLSSFGYCRGNGNNGTFIWGDTATEGHELNVIGQMHWAVTLGDVRVDASKSHGSSLLSRQKTWPFTEDGSDKDMGDDLSKVFDGGVADMVEQATDVIKESCPGGRCTAILDTGSNIIAGPSRVIKSINKLLNVKPDCSNFDSLPNIEMTFGGLPVKIPPSGYVMKVPMPKNPFGAAGSMGDDKAMHESSSQEEEESEPSHAHRHHSRHSDLEAGLAEGSTGSGERAETKQRWEVVFESLNRDYGVDLRDLVEDIFKAHHDASKKFLCMPALVPLDKETHYGPLWVVGTPLLDEYYARWSFAKTDKAPKIHLKALRDAEVCKDNAEDHRLGRAAPALMRSHKESGAKLPTSMAASRGPTERLPEEIAYPHWAKDLLHV